MTSAILFQPTQLYGCTPPLLPYDDLPGSCAPPSHLQRRRSVLVCATREKVRLTETTENCEKRIQRGGQDWPGCRRVERRALKFSRASGPEIFGAAGCSFFLELFLKRVHPNWLHVAHPLSLSLTHTHTHTHTQIPPSPQSSHVLKLEDQTEHRTRSFGRGRTTIGLRRRNP